MFRILFHEPRIAGNTGAAIRLAAVTGAELHLVEPLGFDLEESKLRRAGLDYHDLAVVSVHADLDAALEALDAPHVYAFTAGGDRVYTEVAYEPGDVLMFGAEPTGLPAHVQDDPRVTARVRLPMLPGRRSMNLANTASVAVFEAWRQHGFAIPE
ncbi:tRNA (cytidine(34)-2'-O)-methyltransferase [Aeromicrobium sp. NPDC092404]|uniref:tRNA (cytidine(34)-2'-O)-methyltransferase n=1 Tax=Aeromicrobium sp. NPDC092404 TaxID=3154976 RepID=UPI0034310DFC